MGLDKAIEFERLGQFTEALAVIKTLEKENKFGTKLIEIRILLKKGQFKLALSKTEEIYDQLNSQEITTEILEFIFILAEIQLYLGNPNQSKHYLDLAQKHLKTTDFDNKEFVHFEAKYNLLKGVFLELKSEFKKAIKHFDIAQKLYDEIFDEDGTATTLYHIGRTLQKQGNLVVALDRLEESLRIREKIGNPYNILEN